MLQPTTLLRSLGNRGAVANVEAVLAERRREAWLVESLLHRLTEREAAPAAPAVAHRSTRAA